MCWMSRHLFLDVRYKLELLAILERMARKKHITVIMSLHEIDLAQKVSDKIICVKGDTIAHYGKPEEVFKEDTIRSLYEIDNGSFDPVFGSIELPKIEGEPEVFVIRPEERNPNLSTVTERTHSICSRNPLQE